MISTRISWLTDHTTAYDKHTVTSYVTKYQTLVSIKIFQAYVYAHAYSKWASVRVPIFGLICRSIEENVGQACKLYGLLLVSHCQTAFSFICVQAIWQ